MAKRKAMLFTVLFAIFLGGLFIASCYIEIEYFVPLAILLYPIGVGYLFCDIIKSFYKWLVKDKESEVKEDE